MTPPVLFLIFNRPDKTRAIFETIRSARPARLYVAADGPRTEDEAAICAETRAVIDDVDWPCEVKTLFRAQNLGCGRAVSGAISWFFENEPEGVILEDDIKVDPGFFSFAAEMLERYRDDPRVMSVTACNMLPDALAPEESYYFSAFMHVWGWASWRRAWAQYDFTLSALDTPEAQDAIRAMCPVPGALAYWMNTLTKVREGQIDTWDYQWVFAQWMQGGLTVTPQVNMMQNIGFDASATHTTSSDIWEASLRAKALPRPIVHPAQVQRNSEADDHVARNVLGIKPPSLSKRVKRWLRKDKTAWL